MAVSLEIDKLARDLNWTCLEGYGLSRLPDSDFQPDSIFGGSLSPISPHFLSEQICQKLVPIHDFKASVARNRVPTSIERVVELKVANNILVFAAGGAQMNISKVEADMSNRIKTGDNTTFNNDIFQGQELSGDFRKTVTQVMTTLDSAENGGKLTELLKELTTESRVVAASLSPEQQDEMAQDLDLLATEAIKPKPRGQWIETAANGLLSAATLAGTVGKPLCEAIEKLKTLFE